MKIVQTLWTKPGLTGGWLNPAYHFMSWCLSCLQLRKYYDEVELYTDALGKSILIDALELPYTKVHVELGQLDFPDYYWALPKIYVYGLQQSPFLHVDGDIFIWNNFFGSSLAHDVVYQNMEFERAADLFYSITIEKLKTAAGNTILPDWIDYYAPGKVQAVNAGVFGGTNTGFFQEHARLAFELFDRYKNLFDAMRFPQSANHLLEQVLSRVLLDKAGWSHKGFLPSMHLDGEEGCEYEMFDHYGISPLGCKYMHLLGYLKVDQQTCKMLAKRLSISYPEFYEKVLRQYSNGLLPAEKNAGKWAHSIFMPGIVRQHAEQLCTFRQVALQSKPQTAFPRTALLFGHVTGRDLPGYPVPEFTQWMREELRILPKPGIKERLIDLFEFELECYQHLCSIDNEAARHLRDQEISTITEQLLASCQPFPDETTIYFNNDCLLVYSAWDWTKKFNFDTLAVNFRKPPSQVQTVIAADTLFLQLTEYNITRLCQAILYVFYEPKSYAQGLEDLREFIEDPADSQTNKRIFEALVYLLTNNILAAKSPTTVAANGQGRTLQAASTKPSLSNSQD